VTTPGQRLHREDTRQELPPRRKGLVYCDPHSRGLNHVLDLFGTVHGAIDEDNEQALWSLREILDLYGEYHSRAMACEATRPRGWVRVLG